MYVFAYEYNYDLHRSVNSRADEFRRPVTRSLSCPLSLALVRSLRLFFKF
jgi:hypothetical protein